MLNFDGQSRSLLRTNGIVHTIRSAYTIASFIQANDMPTRTISHEKYLNLLSFLKNQDVSHAHIWCLGIRDVWNWIRFLGFLWKFVTPWGQHKENRVSIYTSLICCHFLIPYVGLSLCKSSSFSANLSQGYQIRYMLSFSFEVLIKK